MILLIFFLIYPVLVSTTVLILNDRCLVPGTSNYKFRQLERREALELERSRSAAIRARYLTHENASLDQVTKQLTTG